jgi:hypothetical protein
MAEIRKPKTDPYSPEPDAVVSVADDEQATQTADTAALTGDAEWDAVELAETDPNREPYDPAFLGSQA